MLQDVLKAANLVVSGGDIQKQLHICSPLIRKFIVGLALDSESKEAVELMTLFARKVKQYLVYVEFIHK